MKSNENFDPEDYLKVPIPDKFKRDIDKGREVVNLYNRKIEPFNIIGRTK